MSDDPPASSSTPPPSLKPGAFQPIDAIASGVESFLDSHAATLGDWYGPFKRVSRAGVCLLAFIVVFSPPLLLCRQPVSAVLFWAAEAVILLLTTVAVGRLTRTVTAIMALFVLTLGCGAITTWKLLKEAMVPGDFDAISPLSFYEVGFIRGFGIFLWAWCLLIVVWAP